VISSGASPYRAQATQILARREHDRNAYQNSGRARYVFRVEGVWVQSNEPPEMFTWEKHYARTATGTGAYFDRSQAVALATTILSEAYGEGVIYIYSTNEDGHDVAEIIDLERDEES